MILGRKHPINHVYYEYPAVSTDFSMIENAVLIFMELA